MDTLQAIFGRFDTVNTLWNIYVAVALGVVGVMASGKLFTRRTEVKILLTVAFAVFAFGNLDAILQVNSQILSLEPLLDEPFKSISPHVLPPDRSVLVAFHVVLDLIVIGSIWLVAWAEDDTRAR